VRILVTDGESRTALAAVRSLGAGGHEVHVASVEARSLAGASRFVTRAHRVGDVSGEPKAWVDAIRRIAADLSVDSVLPVTDVSLGTLLTFDIERGLPIAGPTREAWEGAVDKHALLQQAARLGIACPRSLLIPKLELLNDLPEAFRFPAVLKPRRSCVLTDGHWSKGPIHIVRDAAELRAVTAGARAEAGDYLLQEFVPGHGEGIFLLAREGRTLVRFAHRRLRERPPTGGTSVLRESIPPDPELLGQAERLLELLRWTGVAMVEFRREPTGRGVLMEVNPRLWGSVQLAIDAGADFPALLVALHSGGEVSPVAARIGVRSRWLLGDVDHLLLSLRSRSMRADTGQRLLPLLGGFLRSFIDGSRTEVLRRGDARPFAREVGSWVRQLGDPSA
jgi:predicted ATP-grasp superfamily ATP-dependent carboligase